MVEKNQEMREALAVETQNLASLREELAETVQEQSLLETQMSWVKAGQEMLRILVEIAAVSADAEPSNDNPDLPIFYPCGEDRREFREASHKRAKDEQEALHSIGVWLYQQIEGASEWTHLMRFYVGGKTTKYPKLKESHRFAEIVNVLTEEEHEWNCEQVETALAGLEAEVVETQNFASLRKEELEARIVELESVILNTPTLTRSEADEGATGSGQKGIAVEGFTIPTRSVRGMRIERSEGNEHDVAEPNQSYLLAEVDLTPPHEAVEQLQAMFPGLDVSNWEQALRIGVGQAVAGCARTNVIPTEMEESRSLDSARDDNVVTLGTNRLVFFPWVKRDALVREIATALADAGPRNDSVPHYGALLEQGIFPKLKQVYQEKHNLGFKNYRAGKMSEDKFLQMRSEVAEWLAERETEVEGDICFSGAILDLFHGHSVNSSRYEVENNYPNLVLGTSYITNQMLLTQSQLQTAWRQLHWDIAGDKYDHEGNVSFPSSLYCRVSGSKFRFDYVRTDYAYSHCSAFVLPRAV